MLCWSTDIRGSVVYRQYGSVQLTLSTLHSNWSRGVRGFHLNLTPTPPPHHTHTHTHTQPPPPPPLPPQPTTNNLLPLVQNFIYLFYIIGMINLITFGNRILFTYITLNPVLLKFKQINFVTMVLSLAPIYIIRNKKNKVYPCKPQFYYIKVGSTIGFHLLWHTIELAMSTRLCLL